MCPHVMAGLKPAHWHLSGPHSVCIQFLITAQTVNLFWIFLYFIVFQQLTIESSRSRDSLGVRRMRQREKNYSEIRNSSKLFVTNSIPLKIQYRMKKKNCFDSFSVSENNNLFTDRWREKTWLYIIQSWNVSIEIDISRVYCSETSHHIFVKGRPFYKRYNIL